jgi:DNA-binding transcriptional ArsR family regulator
MTVKREFRDRSDVEVEILDALVDRSEDGMTVFELRSVVGVDIDEIERGLESLKRDDLIDVEENGNRTVIKPDDRIIPEEGIDTEPSLIDSIRERLPF